MKCFLCQEHMEKLKSGINVCYRHSYMVTSIDDATTFYFNYLKKHFHIQIDDKKNNFVIRCIGNSRENDRKFVFNKPSDFESTYITHCLDKIMKMKAFL